MADVVGIRFEDWTRAARPPEAERGLPAGVAMRSELRLDAGRDRACALEVVDVRFDGLIAEVTLSIGIGAKPGSTEALT